MREVGLPPETDWLLDDACDASQPEEFEALLRHLDNLKAEAIGDGRSPESVLPERIASVALWNIRRHDLDNANRCGAAWTVLATGMHAHGWRVRSERSRVLLYRARFDLFERFDNLEALVEFIELIYVPPIDHRVRQFLRGAVLDRKEHERVDARIKYELEFRSRNPADAVHGHQRGHRKPKRSVESQKKRKRKR
ncbi:MAG: hypothetical protein QOJ67_3493 [Acidimicrobiaceae bacterium]|jgi:hypothetical protein